MLKFTCPHCRSPLKAPENKRGTTLGCPRCQNSVMVPPSKAIRELAVLDKECSPVAESVQQLLRKPRRFGSFGWFLAFGAGLLLAIPCEIVLFNTFAEGNHRLGHEIDRAHGYHEYQDIPSYSDERERVDRDYPDLSWGKRDQIVNQRLREAHDREKKAGEEANYEYSMLFEMRATRTVIIGLLIAVISFSLSFGTLIWLKRTGRIV